jgi:hypothetical protein
MKASKFFDELEKSIHEFVELETLQGTVRKGKVTGFTYRRIFFNGQKIDVVNEIELNGDPTDRISLIEIKTLENE